jgi:ribose 1,5-bisphosphokinase
VVFAHRYITRPADAGGENHVALSDEEFQARLSARLFALHWHSHGHAYGIGIEINQWLAKGVTVVVNGSRAYLSEARRAYPELLPVWIEVSPQVLRQRLLKRGRETAEEIKRRLARHQNLRDGKPGGEVIRNDGRLEEAGDALVALIRRRSGISACA